MMTFDEKQVEQLLTAIRFSSEKHRQQRRKDPEASPYINHPIQVAELLWRVGGVRDMEIVLGALLHDTIEDTATTPEEIEEIFGRSIRNLVMEVTDDHRLPKSERKRLQITEAAKQSVKARTIKLADKICNVRDVTYAPPTGWSVEKRIEYLDWTEHVIHGIRSTNSALESLYDEVLHEARKMIQQ
ncbi:MAG: bifunctional (p)ppGpp synthetase/guanosine-3',5'-bis(diphosphate) 3'-pyrophosphohydrolase [Bacteroidetes bacterium]|nr:bifunctional (p)ppGpp synthetase/guanosine-3',5'-bis(diphosphate) 3'-pyrophosphohydrolase [Bacteroidota bacterium]